MAHYKSTKSSKATELEIIYTDCTTESIAQLIEDMFAKERYSIKTGDLGNRSYFKGNFAAKFFLGPFSEYLEFLVYTIDLGNGDVKMTMRKSSSGIVDGINGRRQTKKELERLKTTLIAL